MYYYYQARILISSKIYIKIVGSYYLNLVQYYFMFERLLLRVPTCIPVYVITVVRLMLRPLTAWKIVSLLNSWYTA